eukprot:TRINITY_DN4152_c0_g2_i1.p1 TRINITY_DN4152_c0_g2~~TRINITY_DN4152_c0_g2_i1.p1  ORF type:complete len:308 (+),score=82.70 TRINITY_DN4152_c0_g2_i1:116-1039(+)
MAPRFSFLLILVAVALRAAAGVRLYGLLVNTSLTTVDTTSFEMDFISGGIAGQLPSPCVSDIDLKNNIFYTIMITNDTEYEVSLVGISLQDGATTATILLPFTAYAVDLCDVDQATGDVLVIGKETNTQHFETMYRVDPATSTVIKVAELDMEFATPCSALDTKNGVEVVVGIYNQSTITAGYSAKTGEELWRTTEGCVDTMVYNPVTGLIYGVAIGDYEFDLYSIDGSTGVTTFIGVVQPGAFTWMYFLSALDPQTNTLYCLMKQHPLYFDLVGISLADATVTSTTRACINTAREPPCPLTLDLMA